MTTTARRAPVTRQPTPRALPPAPTVPRVPRRDSAPTEQGPATLLPDVSRVPAHPQHAPAAAWPTPIQRCGIGSSCDCPPHEKVAGIQRDLRRVTAGGGTPLSAGARDQMGPAFSSDFTAVRVHTGPGPDAVTSALQAQALTVGTHILFRSGAYRPGTPGGDLLLGHELAHVVQQAQGLPQAAIDGRAADPLERAASRAADLASPMARREGHGGAAAAARAVPVAAAAHRTTNDTAVTKTPPVQRQTADAGDAGSSPDPAETAGAGAPADRGDQAKFRQVKVWANAFIPANVPGVTIPRPDHSGETMVGGGGLLAWLVSGGAKTTDECYLGDSRDFSSEIHASSRMHFEVEIGSLDANPALDFQSHQCGTSYGIDRSSGNELESATASTSRMTFSNLRGNYTVDPIAGVNTDPRGSLVQIDYAGAAAMPLLPSPDIDMNFTFKADPAAGTVEYEGAVDQFPAFEIYTAVYNGAPVSLLNLMPEPGKTPANLFGDANRPVRGTATF